MLTTFAPNLEYYSVRVLFSAPVNSVIDIAESLPKQTEEVIEGDGNSDNEANTYEEAKS